MRMQTFSMLCIITLGILLTASLASADGSWSILFITSITDHPQDMFEAGFNELGTDDYDAFTDAFQLTPPGGNYTSMVTQVGPYPLTKDFRGHIEGNKTWQIKKTAVDDEGIGLSGTDSMSWTINNIPANIGLTLIDYGSDSTRSNPVTLLNLKEISRYDFEVNNAIGDYRFMDLVLTKNNIPGDANGDCAVNVFDIIMIIRSYNTSPGDPKWNPDADLNDDGRVNIRDLLQVIRHFRDTC